jgi:hypothetical protein
MCAAGDDALSWFETSLDDDSVSVLGAQSDDPLHKRLAFYLDVHNAPALNIVDGRSRYHDASLRLTDWNGDADGGADA